MRKKDERFYPIGVVAKMFNIHQQTLRLYEREGLLKPARSQGNTRLYAEKDLERLDLILNLSREMGVNLAGVEIILNLREKMQEMQDQINELLSYLRTELERNVHKEARPEDKSIVKAPSANLIRFSQLIQKRAQ